MKITQHILGCRKPEVSLLVPISTEMHPVLTDYLRYLREIDYPALEVVVVLYEDGDQRHPSVAYNTAARAATTECVVLTALDVHPSASIIARTHIELREHPDSVVLAMRLDGLPDYRACCNPFALGDWLAIRRDRFLALGGYDESLRPAQWLESEFIGRAAVNCLDIVMLDERVFHAWHPVRTDEGELARDSEWNRQHILESGGSLALLYYPTTAKLESGQRTINISVRPQSHSVVNITHHVPYNSTYWADIMLDKAKRLSRKT